MANTEETKSDSPGLRWGAQGEQGIHGEKGCGSGCLYCKWEQRITDERSAILRINYINRNCEETTIADSLTALNLCLVDKEILEIIQSEKEMLKERIARAITTLSEPGMWSEFASKAKKQLEGKI